MALDRSDRLRAAVDRDGPTCIWCGRAFTHLMQPTTEHVVPRVKGGPSWLENEVAACRRCNGARGHTGPVEWLEECARRGWQPDEPRLLRALTGLEAAIARAGGQRRARPYLDAQLRRMHRRTRPAVCEERGAGGLPAERTERLRATGGRHVAAVPSGGRRCPSTAMS